MSEVWSMYERYIRRIENEMDLTGQEIEIMSYDEFYDNYLSAMGY